MCVTGYNGAVDTDAFRLNMRLENGTQKLLCREFTWYLERWIDGGWQAVARRPIGVQDTPLVSIHPGETLSEAFRPSAWVREFGEPGKYRAITVLYDYDDDDARYWVSAEFTLTEDFAIEPLSRPEAPSAHMDIQEAMP